MIVAVVLVILFLAKDFIASTLLTVGVSSFTELTASVESLDLGVFKSAVDVKGFKLYNPRNYLKDRVMMDIPELYINYDPGSFMTGTKHLKEVKLYLKEFVVVKNELGELNLDSIKAIQAKMGQESGGKNQDSKFKIDVLELKIDKVVYKDYSRGGSPVVKEFNVGIDERYTNITNPYSFASLIVFKALINTSIASLAHFDLGPLKDSATDALVTAVDAAAGAVGVSSGAAKKAVSKTTDVIKGLLPFGK
jgi:hypothetical protein